MQASELARSIQLNELIRAEGNACLAAFAEILERAHVASIEEFLSTRPAKDRSELAGLIALDLRHRWMNGSLCPIESYFDRFPELKKDREQVLDLIYAEYCERRQHRIVFESDEYYRRFPDFQQSLARLFRIDSLLQEDSLEIEQRGLEALCLLEEGEEFLDFQLVTQLGRGAFGRVFLAKQMNLSDRLVVVKITPLRSIEHQTLARLQHPNIVPVLSVHPDGLRGLRAVCMPYQSGTALSDVQAIWRSSGMVPERAKAFIDSVHSLVPSDLRRADVEVAGTQFPKHESYIYACSWLMFKLAGALAHAHSRGIYHRDLKPSNILLSATVQPLLVDFNLAFNPSESQGDAKVFFGGTLPYMPPEQLQALHPEEPGNAEDVGPRSDVYSLAATVFELLTGQLPFALPKSGSERLAALRAQLELRYAQVPSARRLNPQVPPDLDALLSKCLQPSPLQRYDSAAELAEELERFLKNRPLRHIGLIPKRMRAVKFLRRNRRRLGLVAALVFMGASLTAIVFVAHENSRRAQIARQVGEIRRQEAAEANENSRRAEQEAADAHENTRRAEIARQRVEQDLEKTDLALERTTADLKKTVEENEPTEPHEFITRGLRYQREKRYKDAEADFTMGLDIGYSPKELAFCYRGISRAGQDTKQKDKEAQEDYTAAIEANPNYWRPYLCRALNEVSSKFGEVRNFDLAVRDAEKALELFPQDPRVKDTPSVMLYLYLNVARVYAGASDKNPERLKVAERWLFEAVRKGQKIEQFRDDNLLKPLLELPEVQDRLAQIAR